MPLDEMYQASMRNCQRSIGYTPDAAKSSSQYRRMRLTAKDKSPIVQAREGYYPADK
jgi:hypothetical protein